jgi:Flp pilus assembly protein TadD
MVMRRLLRTLSPVSIVVAAAIVIGVLLGTGCGARQHAQIEAQAENLQVELAETYIAKGASEAAIPLLRRILAERPRDARVRVLYATVLRDQGLYPQAEKHFLAALALRTDYPPAHAGVGILYDLLRDSARALAHHRAAAAAAPGMASYRNNLGFSLYLAGDVDGAVRELEAALALDPGLAIAYNNLGFAYGRLGQYAEAERTFRAIGNPPATLLNMSLVYEEHGEHARARALREEAYALAPDLRPDGAP